MLAAQLATCYFAQPVVDQLNDLVESLVVPLLPRMEQSRDLV